MTEKIKRISDATEYDRYWDFLTSTKIYKELLFSKEALISFTVSGILVSMLVASNWPNRAIEFSSESRNIIEMIISCEVGILGFLIGGLALIVGSIGLKVMRKIDDSGGFVSLLEIFFRFYFEGSLLALEIILALFAYILIGFPSSIHWVVSGMLAWLIGYLFVYTLIAGTMLMGSCIRLMIMNYELSERSEK